MVGFNWVYKNNQLNRWCQYTLPVNLFVSFISFFISSHAVKQLSSTSNILWINLNGICFPQKYIVLSMQSDGFRPANLQLLFSSKSRPEPAECSFSSFGMLRPCLSADGLPLVYPFLKGIQLQYNVQTGSTKGEFNPVAN